MRYQASLTFACLLSSIAVGCGAELEDELDLPLDDRATYPLPPDEDTPLAYGMLRVANELDFDALDVDVALDRRSATSIIAHRAGADELLGTADDDYVDSIAELDSLYWMGPANIWRIQSYAMTEGYVPGALPAPTCEPALAGSIEQCLRFVEDAATPVPGPGGFGQAPFSADLRPSCLEASDATYPSASYFADAGLPGYLDPLLGHHGQLCVVGSDAICELGVAGLASWVAPECDALYDVEPVLGEHVPDPAVAASWAAAVAALDASSPDNSYFLRVYEYAPGMTPTLLGDTMEQVLVSAPIEYSWPYLEREASDVLPPMSAGAQTLLVDVADDLGLSGASFDVGTASEEVPCPNCHIFHDAVVLMYRDARLVIVLDRDTFWDS
ncbi:MAG: hypothetical protein H6712_14410 [Myxococcales bacterium]|nr:hypothetical protein [Myxococcales bacterium]MCB9715056.1 hypothetical protein [Myxococcales bacterium]